MPKKLTTEEFIEKSNNIHNFKYDYSLVNYINNSTKVKIICKEHDIFEQQPYSHLIRRGCPICAGSIKKTTEEFIENAQRIHGDKYDYSLVDYENTHKKVKIICKEHEIFEQSPHSHLKNQGCPICGIIQRTITQTKTTEEFIIDANKIHNNKYDYSLVDYINSKTKVKIICEKHGEFEQYPNSHIQNNGCDKCGGTYKKTTEEFIENAQRIHGDKYDYSLVDYINGKTKVKIICKEHGIFKQVPYDHLKGSKCSKCYETHKKTTEEFIENAQRIHGDKYDYSLVDYINANTKVKIICHNHGEFEQEASGHINKKYGCPSCSGLKRKTTEQFILDAKKIHGNKYDYSLVDYENAHKKVKIICKEHEIFEQSPHSHINKKTNCPKCARIYYTPEESDLYILYDKIIGLYKIGRSTKTNHRLKELNRNYYDKEKNLLLMKNYKLKGKYEDMLHKKYNQLNINHPLYNEKNLLNKLNGHTEWFKLEEKHLQEIDDIINS